MFHSFCRKYLMNVINTVYKHSIRDIVLQKRRENEKRIFHQTSIPMTNEFFAMYQVFQSLRKARKDRTRLNLRWVKKQCPCCFTLVEEEADYVQFECHKHAGHRDCVQSYDQSLFATQNPQFSCPLRCEREIAQP